MKHCGYGFLGHSDSHLSMCLSPELNYKLPENRDTYCLLGTTSESPGMTLDTCPRKKKSN